MVWLTCKVQIYLPWFPALIIHEPATQQWQGNEKVLERTGDGTSSSKMLSGKGESPFNTKFIPTLVFLPLVTVLTEKPYPASEIKHKSNLPIPVIHQKLRGDTHSSKETMSFVEMGLNNQHHHGLSLLVMNIRYFYQIRNLFLCWFPSWKCRDCFLLNWNCSGLSIISCRALSTMTSLQDER